MTHYKTTAKPRPSGDPTADWIAGLAQEWFTATPERQGQIGEETAAAIEGRVVPMGER